MNQAPGTDPESLAATAAEHLTAALGGAHDVAVVMGSGLAPAADAFGNTRGHLNLEAVIDRTEYEMNWNAPLPSGGKALANEVTLTVELSLVEQQA